MADPDRDEDRYVRLNPLMLKHRPGGPFRNSFQEGDLVDTPLGPGRIDRMAFVEPKPEEGGSPRYDVWVELDDPCRNPDPEPAAGSRM